MKVAFAIVLALLGAFASETRAEPEQVELYGRYVLMAQDGERIETAIDAVVAKMNFIKRPIARSRLKKTNPLSQRIAIARTTSHIEIAFDDHVRVQMPVSGAPAKWKRDDGELLDVSAVWESGALVQTFKAEDGQRINTYRLKAERDLTLDVEVTSDQLPSPLRYRLLYRRQP